MLILWCCQSHGVHFYSVDVTVQGRWQTHIVAFLFHLFDQLTACEETGFVRFHLGAVPIMLALLSKLKKPYRDVPRSDPTWSIHVVGPTVDDGCPKNQTIQMTQPSRSSKQCGFM